MANWRAFARPKRRSAGCRVFKIVEAKTVITLDYWAKKILPVGFFMVRPVQAGEGCPRKLVDV